MENDDSWKVWVAGSKFSVTNIWLRNNNSSVRKAGPKYLRSKGLTLEPIYCSKMDDGNYDALYKVSAPGKSPIMIEITTNSGSGGTWYIYQVIFDTIKKSDFPDDVEIGICNIND